MKLTLAKTLLGTAPTFISYHLGGFDTALNVFVTLIILDYITGLLSAGYNGRLNSKEGFKGIIKKIMYFAILTLAVSIDRVMNLEGIFRTAAIMFFIGNEGLSILENYASCGLPFPQSLKKKLEQLRDEEKE